MFNLRFLAKIFIALIAIATLGFVAVTFYFIADISDIKYETLHNLISIDLCLLLLMVVIVLGKIMQLTVVNVEKSKLRTKVILMFICLSLLPTAIVTTFSTVFFNYGMKSWFNKRVSQALNNSVIVAEAYLKERANVLSMESFNLAQELKEENIHDIEKLNDILNKHSYSKGLTEAVILQSNTIIAKSKLSFSISFDRIPVQFIYEAKLGEIVVFTNSKEGKVRALINIPGHESIYLLISKLIDKQVIKHVASTKIAVSSYLSLQKNINNIQWQFFLVFIFFSLLLVMFSTWCAIYFSNILLRPVIDLAHATQRISAGDFEVELTVFGKANDEISHLARSFNNMTKTLSIQRKKLLTANEDLTQRHIFIQTIISDLSSGVIVINIEHRITLLNNIVYKFFNLDSKALGSLLIDIFPEAMQVLDGYREGVIVEKKIELLRGEEKIHLLLRTSSISYQEESIDGYVITFDDISNLVSAQKALTWSEVAKRIAHEIKNPITPIYLATERLEKFVDHKNKNIVKYLSVIKRNVRQISAIINEFSHFARLPTPTLTLSDMHEVARHSIHSAEIAFEDIKCEFECHAEHRWIKCDANQIGCSLDNILKNACEAMIDIKNPEIKISIGGNDNYMHITIEDNGPGFSKELIPLLTDPYVTSKVGGTGLGLAIVKKIVGEHGGKLEFCNVGTIGARVNIALPYIANFTPSPKVIKS